MEGMREFLEQIGAGSISPTIDESKEVPRLASLHERLQLEIQSIDDQTRDLLETNWTEFEEQLTQGQTLLDGIKSEERLLLELESQLDGEHAILPPLISQLSLHSTLAVAHSQSLHTLTALNSILSLHSSIQLLATSITLGALPLAVSHLESLKESIRNGPGENWISNLDAWNGLRNWAKEEELRLERCLVDTLELCFEFQGASTPTTITNNTSNNAVSGDWEGGSRGGQEGETKCIMREKIRAAPGGDMLSFISLLSSLERMLSGSGRTIHSHLAKIAKQLLKYFLIPFLESNGKVGGEEGEEKDIKLEWTYEEFNDGVRVMTLRPQTLESTKPLMEELESFLAYFAVHSALLPPSPYASIFTAQLTPALQSLIISHHLSPSLPSSIKLLSPYLNILGSASTFESQFLLQRGYLAFLPSPSTLEGSQPLEESRLIQDWIQRVDLHWGRKLGDTTLVMIRNLIVSNDWMGEKVDYEIMEDELVSPLVPFATLIRSPPPPVKQVLLSPPPPPPVAKVEPPPPPPPPVTRGRKLLGTRIITSTTTNPTLPLPSPSNSSVLPSHATSIISPSSSTTSTTTNTTPIAPRTLPEPSSSISPPPPNRLTQSLNSYSNPNTKVSRPPLPPLPLNRKIYASNLPATAATTTTSNSLSKSTSSALISTPIPRISARTSPRKIKVVKLVEEDDWGFGDEIEVEEEEEAEVEPEVEKGEDAWGFGDETEEMESMEPIEEVGEVEDEKEEQVEDGWGFGEEEAETEGEEITATIVSISTTMQKKELVEPIVVEQVGEEEVEVEAEEEEGAWGFDEEAVAVVTSPIISPSSPSIASPQASLAQISQLVAQDIELPISPGLVSPSFLPQSTVVSPANKPGEEEVVEEDEEEEEEPNWGWEEDDAKNTSSERKISRPSIPVPVPVSVPLISNNSNGGGPVGGVVDSLRRIEGGRRKRKELRMISVKSRLIVETAEKLLVEALEVGGKSFPYPTFAPSSPLLLKTFQSILSLYRATVPIHHATLLETLPAVSMQFANDSEWISEEIGKAWKKHSNTISKGKGRELIALIGIEEEGIKIERGLKLVGNLGKDWREKQISTQRSSLMATLDEANRFLYTSEDTRYVACERAIAKVASTLDRLAEAWKPIMNPSALYTTLGSLVNDVLLRVLTEIEDQADISEEESIRLNKLCKALHGLESLFLGGPSSVGREVNVWFKFVFLSELLEASMADILFLFDNGHLVDFSTDEIIKLVRALFSDSALRTKNIEHIMTGHPAVDNSSSDEEDFQPNGWH